MTATSWGFFDSAGMEAGRDFFGRLVRQGGPTPAEYGAFHCWLEQMARILAAGGPPAAEVRALWAAGGPATASRRTLQGFARARPHGYVGDFELLDRVCQRWISPDPALEKWDRFFQAHPAADALRQRQDYFQAWLADAEGRQETGLATVHLLHLGGGPARELRDYFMGAPHSRVTATYLDPDAAAIAYAAGRCVPIRRRMKFQQAHPFGFLPAQKPQLIWSAGLLDAVDDENAVALLHRLWRLLLPGGELVAADLAARESTRSYLDLLGWTFHYRTAAGLWDLARQAGVPEAALRVGRGAEGADLFLHTLKPAAAHLPAE